MKPPRYDPTQLAPLTTDALIEERISALIGRATRRQIWFMFVDEGGVQLPILLPIEDHPSRPDTDDAQRFALLLAGVREAADARGTVIVIERYADATLTRSDIEWARALHEAADASTVDLKAILLSHSTGVRWVAPDDYLFPVTSAFAR